MMQPAEIPVLPRGVRVHHDGVRDAWVLLAPERVLSLDPVGQAILAQVDGARSFGEIVAALAAAYNAPETEIARDAAEFLGALRDRRFLEVRP